MLGIDANGAGGAGTGAGCNYTAPAMMMWVKYIIYAFIVITFFPAGSSAVDRVG